MDEFYHQWTFYLTTQLNNQKYLDWLNLYVSWNENILYHCYGGAKTPFTLILRLRSVIGFAIFYKSDNNCGSASDIDFFFLFFNET